MPTNAIMYSLHETLVDLRELPGDKINSPQAFNQIIAALSYIEDQLAKLLEKQTPTA